jgi:DNA polymerase-3 subunit alpha
VQQKECTDNAVVKSAIVQTRASEPYKSIFDFAKRVDLRAANKKAFESLAYAGGFDGFKDTHRAQYFYRDGDGSTGIEKAIKFGHRYKENEQSAQVSLFGGSAETSLPEPLLTPCAAWGLIEKLKYEKDVIGIYLTSHPLDNYKFEIDNFCPNSVTDLQLINKVKETIVEEETLLAFNKIKNKEVVIGGIITNVAHRISKAGKPFGSFIIEDYSDSFDMAIFGEDYVKFKGYLQEGYFVQLRGLVQERFRQVGNWGFELKNIQLLSDLRDKLAKSFTIQIDLNKMDGEMIGLIDELVRSTHLDGEQANCALKFHVMDPEQRLSVEMPAKTTKIRLTNALLEGLDELEGIRYKLN